MKIGLSSTPVMSRNPNRWADRISRPLPTPMTAERPLWRA